MGELGEGPEEDRRRLRNPVWWLTAVGAVLVAGIGWEAVAAALGAGDFTLRTGVDNALLPFLGLVAVTLISAIRR